MFKSLAKIILRSRVIAENANRRKHFLSWDKIGTIALVINNSDKINKSAMDKFIDGTGKNVDVYYVETDSKKQTFSDWQCFSKKDTSFLGLLTKKTSDSIKQKKFDLVINTSPDFDLYACNLVAAIPATLKSGSINHFNELDLIVKKADPYHIIDYLNEVIKYLKMIRS